MLVSIIIPCFNAERYVGEAIQSALDQTYPHCEIIVIDDGSTDGSLEIIKRFSGKIHWETGANRGGAAARNTGLRLASGEYIQFLDADDLLEPECVEAKVRESLKFADTPICVCSPVGYHESSGANTDLARLALRGHVWWTTNFSWETIILRGSPQTAAPLHRKKTLLEIGGFDEDLPCAQELALHLALYAEKNIRFHVLAESIRSRVLIRPLLDSVTGRNSGIIHKTIVGVLQRHAIPFIENSGPDHDYASRILCIRLSGLYHVLMRRGDTGNARQCISLIRQCNGRLSTPFLDHKYGILASLLGEHVTAHLMALVAKIGKC